jgi:transcriptional regulator with XRE-family HTH domain
MNIIRQLRQQTNVTQQELAHRAGTSQSTIAAYETGSKSPTLRTIHKLAGVMGMELEARFIPRLTREDHRSLAYHRAVVDKLHLNPKETIARAHRNLKRLKDLHPHAHKLLNQWSVWLDLPQAVLAQQIIDHSEHGRDMRQVSPFAGVLSAAERTKALMSFRSERAA